MAEKSERGGADGFLGRWARRKNDALQGKPLEEPAATVKPPPVSPASSKVAGALPAATEDHSPKTPSVDAEVAPQRQLSLDDARLLTKDSDFKPFMASNVGPEIRNAAMKKLFADPHFNVMDGLDIYIDDYSISEPIPESMLRQMASAKFLKLFDDEEDKDQGVAESVDNQVIDVPGLQPDGKAPGDEVVATSQDQPQAAGPDAPAFLPHHDSSQPGLLADAVASPKEHDHTDLRLQPDDAASNPEAGRGT